LRIALALGAGLLSAVAFAGAPDSTAIFKAGATAYKAGDYVIAAEAFSQAGGLTPSTGSFLNLGNSEWRRGRAGRAIVAWERAAWIDPANKAARNNLEFARKAAQLDAPYLAWHEVASTWLPVNWWAWLTGISLWTAIGAALLPGVLRLRRAAWHQALAPLGLVIFLLSLPAHVGVVTRARLGFVLERDTPLRLTPTQEGQYSVRLASGEPARVRRFRGKYAFVHTRRAQGWIETRALGLIVPLRDQNVR
jgi:tetratricopeptide (TPR) repeat protein